MAHSKVSIITVCFNAAQTIAETLDSVAAQMDADIEHIVVDGNSSDGTQNIVQTYRRDNLVFVSEPDNGLYDAMNKGVQMASGDIIAFLNADDVYAHTDVVNCAVTALNKHAVSCVYADLVFVDALDTSLVKRVWSSQPHKPRLCFSGWMPAHPTLFMRRIDFIELGGFNLSLKYQSDLEFCTRAFEVEKLSSHYVPQVWVRMRLGGISTGAWSTRIKGNWESYIALRRLGLKRDPLSYFVIKFGRKLPQFFLRQRFSEAELPDKTNEAQ